MVEILKQNQYVPMPIANQITVIYAGVNGFMDELEIEQNASFEAALINHLSSTNKKASSFLLKSVNSAVANINYNDDANFENDELYIKKVLIDGGPTIKRFRPAAMGRAVPIKKRTSHITIVIESK